jgi:hypothetical protein
VSGLPAFTVGAAHAVLASVSAPRPSARARLARITRGGLEAMLDRRGRPWPWDRRVSSWIDRCVLAEEDTG